jgi:hypothetical protein
MNICLMEHYKNSTWNIEPISLQLMDSNCESIHARAYTVPRSVEQQLYHGKEIIRLVHIGVLEEEADYSSECASPSIAIPRKNGTIRVVTYFRSQLPFPIPKIGDMIDSME